MTGERWELAFLRTVLFDRDIANNVPGRLGRKRLADLGQSLFWCMLRFCQISESTVVVNMLGEQDSDENRSWLRRDWPGPYLVDLYKNMDHENRTVSRTEKGYLGMGPPAAEKGDLVFVLPGCTVPFVLRKIESGYRVIGECYTHGIMDGEAIVYVANNKLSLEELEIY